MNKVLLWTYRALCYICPSLILLWTFVIENIMDKEVSVMSKLGVGGLFVLIILSIICLFFIDKKFTKKEKDLEKQSIQEIDAQKRAELIMEWKKQEMYHALFKRILMLVFLIIITVLVILLESKLLALRGTMITITISFCGGCIAFAIKEGIELKNKKKE